MHNPEISLEKGRAYRAMGLLAEAVLELQSALESDRLIPKASLEIAACMVAQNQPVQAERVLLRALCGNASAVEDRLALLMALADLYDASDRIEAALERLLMVQALDGQYTPDLDERIEGLRDRLDSCSLDAQTCSQEPPQDDDKSATKVIDSNGGPSDTKVLQYVDARRKAPRYGYRNRVQFSFDQVLWSTGYTTDISSLGMFVLTYEPVPVGSVVFLKFDLPKSLSEATIDIIGQVVRQENKRQRKDQVLGMGIQFVSLGPSAQVSLNLLIEELAQTEKKPQDAIETIRFHCEQCGRILTSPQDAAGKLGKCSCGETVPVPYPTHMPAPDNPLRGFHLAGCRIDKVIGKGSAATVYKGHHLTLDIPVAIKILHSDQKKEGSQLAEKFLKEARVIARIHHANIVGVMNAGEESGHNFIVMQYVQGRSLLQVLESGEKISTSDFLRIFIDVAKALQAAHEHSVVHGDVKPANILLTAGGSAMLVDFGLVKDLKSFKDTKSPGKAMGTPLYMSPEQAQGEHAVDVRSDVYSLGATMYHAAAGRPPFEGASSLDVIRKHIFEMPVPLCESCSGVSAAMSEMVMKAIEKKPEARYQTAEELKQALLRVSQQLTADKFKPIYGKLKRKGLKAAK